MAIVGIDLGTTNSLAAVGTDGAQLEFNWFMSSVVSVGGATAARGNVSPKNGW